MICTPFLSRLRQYSHHWPSSLNQKKTKPRPPIVNIRDGGISTALPPKLTDCSALSSSFIAGLRPCSFHRLLRNGFTSLTCRFPPITCSLKCITGYYFHHHLYIQKLPSLTYIRDGRLYTALPPKLTDFSVHSSSFIAGLRPCSFRR